MIGFDGTIPFVGLFVLFIVLGFYGKYWRRGDLNHVHEWSLAGRRLGTALVFFLIGADIYTAYTFVAIPSGVFAKGSLYFFAIPYVGLTFGVALVTMPRLWSLSREKGYITASDFVKDRFSSKILSILIAMTGIISLLPYIALQIVGMQSVLTVMLSGTANSNTVQEISLLIAFVILAAFTYTSGLRGATLTAVFKDILIWITVIALIVVVPLSIGGGGGGFATAFKNVKTQTYITLSESLVPGYTTLVLGSALALYLYPHAINGVLSSESAQKLRTSTGIATTLWRWACYYGTYGNSCIRCTICNEFPFTFSRKLTRYTCCSVFDFIYNAGMVFRNNSPWYIRRWSGTCSNYGNVTGKPAYKKYHKRD